MDVCELKICRNFQWEYYATSQSDGIYDNLSTSQFGLPALVKKGLRWKMRTRHICQEKMWNYSGLCHVTSQKSGILIGFPT